MQIVNKIQYLSKLRNYDVIFNDDLKIISNVINQVDVYLIIDRKVYDLYSCKLDITLPKDRIMFVDVSEDIKNIEFVMHIFKSIMQTSAKKNIHLVSIGGGIIQDLSGFVASTLYRGVHWSYIPTTLLSLADSCVGGKTSLNFSSFKNLIGTFYPPHEIIINAEFTQTLSDLDYYSGVGEVVKLHLNGGLDTANYFVSNLSQGILQKNTKVIEASIRSCLSIKKSFIEEDEFDQGRRNMLNYGHCFGHALETATKYLYPHGQAVVAGMIMSNFVSTSRGYITNETEQRLLNDLLKPILKIDANVEINVHELIMAMKNDKKRVGSGLPLIIIKNDYSMMKLDDVTEDEANSALSYFKKIFC
jgi:3-dehydroquinate synthase